MKALKTLNKGVLFCLCASLVGCSTGTMYRYSNNASGVSGPGQLGAGTVAGVAIGGSVGGSMDSLDRVKLTRALDKAPGTSTTWVNANSGISYTVTPIQKVTINGNPFCRQYQAVAIKNGNKQQMTGTACVASDGAWSEV